MGVGGLNMEIPREIIVKDDRPDTLEVREMANGDLRYTIKIRGDINDPEFLKKVREFKEKVEKEVLRR